MSRPHPVRQPPVPGSSRRTGLGVAGAVVAAVLTIVGGVIGGVLGGGVLGAGIAGAQGTSSSSASSSSSTSTTYATSSTTYATTSSSVVSTSTSASSTSSSGPVTTPPPGGSVPFPAQVVAPVVTIGSQSSELAVRSIYVTPGAVSGQKTVVVRFREPFDLPRRAYRVSVLVGDPSGARNRTSLVTNGGPLPTGETAKWEGASFEWIATADVSFDPSGLVGIPIPTDVIPDGGLWVEVEDSVHGTFTSPIYGQDAVLGRIVDGRLPTSTFGQRIAGDGTVDEQPVEITDPPVLSSVNQGIDLVTTTAAPTEIAGRKVVATVDIVRFVADFTNGGLAADEIRVDRSAGTVSLVQRRTEPPEDRTSAEGWEVEGLPDGDPGAPATLRFDLEAAAQGVGLELGDSTALGVQRELALDDGSTVVVPGFLATKAWFDEGALAAAAAAPDNEGPAPSAPLGDMVVGDDVADADADAAAQQAALIAVGAGIVALILASIVVMMRRRRLTAALRTDTSRERDRVKAVARLEKRERAGKADAADRLQNLADDLDEMRRTGQITALTAAVVLEEASNGTFVPATGQQAIVVLTGEVPVADPDSSSSDRSPSRPPVEPAEDQGIVTVEDLGGATELPPPDDGRPRNRPARPRRAPVTDPLGLLGDDVGEMSARLDRLAGDPTPDSPP